VNLYTVLLFTDYYELTMAQGFWKRNYMGRTVVYDYFFRRHPFAGGFSVFAGLNTLLDALENFRFEQDDLAYLESLGNFDKGFLDFLQILSLRARSMRRGKAR